MTNKIQPFLCTWNVNGLRAAGRNLSIALLNKVDPDFLCLQEIKLNPMAFQRRTLDFLSPVPSLKKWIFRDSDFPNRTLNVFLTSPTVHMSVKGG